MRYADKSSFWIAFPFIALAVAAGAYIFLGPIQTERPKEASTVRLILKPRNNSLYWENDLSGRQKILMSGRTIMLKRLVDMNVSPAPVISINTNDRIDIRLPKNQETREVIDRLTSTKILLFYSLDDIQSDMNPSGFWRMMSPLHAGAPFKFTSPNGETISSDKSPNKVAQRILHKNDKGPIFTMKDLSPTARVRSGKDKFIVMDIKFKRNTIKKFADYTRKNTGSFLAVTYGDKLLMAPEIREEIPDGEAEITGFANIKEARQISAIINSGALPVEFEIESESDIRN